MSTLASPADRSRWQRLKGPTLLAGGVLAASVLLHLRDPHRSGTWGYCPWLLLTGTYCPGCGGLRAVNDLSRGDLRAAASSNLLFVGSLPIVLAWWGRTMRDRWRGVVRLVRPQVTIWSCVAFGLTALVFTVLRNTGVGAWLAP